MTTTIPIPADCTDLKPEVLAGLRYVAAEPWVFLSRRLHVTVETELRERGLATWAGGNGLVLTDKGRELLARLGDAP